MSDKTHATAVLFKRGIVQTLFFRQAIAVLWFYGITHTQLKLAQSVQTTG
jgi:hypothetical protein